MDRRTGVSPGTLSEVTLMEKVRCVIGEGWRQVCLCLCVSVCEREREREEKKEACLIECVSPTTRRCHFDLPLQKNHMSADNAISNGLVHLHDASHGH